jgi:hypothetical protein
MRRPLISLFVAIGFFLLGGMLISPVTPPGWRVVVGPNGERVKRPRTDAEAREDNLRVLRVNRLSPAVPHHGRWAKCCTA